MKIFSLILAMMCLFVASAACAGGLYLYEIGTPDVSTAHAGAMARAEDASTAFNNPAGMARIKGNQILGSIQPMIINSKFESGFGTNMGGGDGGNAGSVMPAGGFYAVFDGNEKCKLGISLNSFAGLGLDYDDDWAGRYYVQDTALLTFSVNPAIGVRLTENLSVGAAIHFVYGSTMDKIAVNNILDTLPDGSLELEDEAMGVGGRIGILLEPTDTLRFGLVYQTPIKLNFHTKPEFDDLGPGLEFLAPLVLNDLDLSMTLPQQVMGSVFFQATDTLDLMANLGWQEWSEFARDIVTVHTAGQRELGTSIDYDDTWHVAIGARYALTPAWKVSAGIAYDSSIADDDARSATLPVDRAWRYAGGVSYDYDQDMNIGLGYEYIDLGKAELDSTRGPLSGTLEGEYETNAIHVINLTFIYTF